MGSNPSESNAQLSTLAGVSPCVKCPMEPVRLAECVETPPTGCRCCNAPYALGLQPGTASQGMAPRYFTSTVAPASVNFLAIDTRCGPTVYKPCHVYVVQHSVVRRNVKARGGASATFRNLLFLVVRGCSRGPARRDVGVEQPLRRRQGADVQLRSTLISAAELSVVRSSPSRM